MLAFMVQVAGGRFHPPGASLLEPLVLLVAGACVGMLIVSALQVGLKRSRTMLRERRSRRRRRHAVINAEQRARAQMSELCPYGWRAQITLLEGTDAEHGSDPRRERNGVALDWAEIRDETGRAAVMRRVWAPTIPQALDAMVADRRTDETLEQIEQGAAAEGAFWPDL
jgi:hypothetical protein